MGYKEYLEEAKKIKITKHFTLYEVAFSDIALRYNIDNTPNITALTNAVFLIKKVLEPVRVHFNKAVNVNSFYRCVLVNKHPKIKGAKNSQHQFGQAADIYISDIPNSLIVEYIRNNLDFDQLILEPDWVHVSFSLKDNRKQVMKYINGKYINI